MVTPTPDPPSPGNYATFALWQVAYVAWMSAIADNWRFEMLGPSGSADFPRLPQGNNPAANIAPNPQIYGDNGPATNVRGPLYDSMVANPALGGTFIPDPVPIANPPAMGNPPAV